MSQHRLLRDRTVRRRGLLLLITLSIAASTRAAPCPRSDQPSASLLMPYIEVTLDDPSGVQTFVSVNNATDAGVLARVVLWTDWGLPVLAFDLYLAGDAVQPIDLRRLLVDGTLPTTGSGTGAIPDAPHCTDPLTVPRLGPTERARLQAQLTGRAAPGDDLCYGSGARGDQVALGYLTVDVINDCEETIRYPTDPGYFARGGTGLASNANALWGDIYYVHGTQDAAQGLRAVSLVADETLPGEAPTFYRRWAPPFDGRDQRRALGFHHRLRFLRGGAFDGGTEVLAWSAGQAAEVTPVRCGEEPLDTLQPSAFGMRFRTEAGAPSRSGQLTTARRAARLAIGTEPFVPEGPFGSAEVFAKIRNPDSGVPLPTLAVQSWVGSTVRAFERFSVGLDAVCLETDP